MHQRQDATEASTNVTNEKQAWISIKPWLLCNHSTGHTCSRSNLATAGGDCYQLPLLSAAAATQWRSENQRRNRQKSGYKIVAVAVALLPWDIRSMPTSSYSLWNASKISRCQRIWQEHELQNKYDALEVLVENLSSAV